MKIYIIAGEASGDLHGSNLVKALFSMDASLQIRCWGGDLMAQAGAEVVKHYRDLAFMGFVEVVKNLKTITRNMDFCKKDILGFQPDVVVFIDYPGFNMRIAKWLHHTVRSGQLTSRLIYYIAPQAWAWHRSRVHALAQNLNDVLVILPFEEAFFRNYGVNARFVGHPLLDAIPNQENNYSNRSHKIALLPGSRVQEINKMLPIMLEACKAFPDHQVVIGGAGSLPLDLYEPFLKGHEGVEIIFNQTHQLLAEARLAFVKSGTSTLETALLGTPQVVCYKGNPVSYAIAKRVVNIKYISLVNLIADKPVVTELIQNQLTPENLAREGKKLLETQEGNLQLQAYSEIRAKLGGVGASKKAAQIILNYPSS